MSEDLILNAVHVLDYEEIFTYIQEPALSWWREINAFIQQTWQVKPKVTYSKCSAQKGWNVKYQKSGKSICTLYPEKESFIVLLVVKLEVADMIEAMADQYDSSVMNIVKNARPFNGTKWLMLPVVNEAALKSIQELMVFKLDMNTGKKTTGKKKP